ncbi:MAG: branched-chain amino acid ABC transporter permease [Acidimicrobiia bacterium]|nr:branched-chain amino acid ABC transporter permease [Acidimicrobiia bacterium]MCY4433287.1 branched-chain amino acid ABC transporter permease [bacterium]
MADRVATPLYAPSSRFRRAVPSWATFLGVFVFLALLPWLPILGWTDIFDSGNDFGKGNLAFVFAFAIAAVGFNLLVGYSGTLGLAVAGLFALGAYGTAVLSAPSEAREALAGYDWPFFVALPVVCIAAAIIGVLVGFPAARLKGFFLAIATLALGELIVTIIRLDEKVWDGLKTNGGTGKQVPQFRVPGLGRVDSYYMLSLGALFLMMVAYVVLTNRRLGRTLKAVRDIDIATGPIGISSTYYKLVAFGISAFAAALAGAMWAQNSSFANPSAFRTRLLVFLLVVLIVGGLSHKWGPLIGAVFFVFLRQKLQDTQKLLFLILGITLILAVLILPNGIAALPERMRESRWVKDLHRRLQSLAGSVGSSI